MVKKIGVIRHFKVDGYAGDRLSSEEYINWVKFYDIADVIKKEIDMRDVQWQYCFSSDLYRAVTTAKECFKGNIEVTELLREVGSAPILKTKIRFPYEFWAITSRIAWEFNLKNQPEGKRQTIERVNCFLDILESREEDNILIVCHGFLMMTLNRELKKRGYITSENKSYYNGKLYIHCKE